MSTDDLRHLSMLDLFRLEVENQAQVLTAGLLTLERDYTAADQLEACMRAAHSLADHAVLEAAGLVFASTGALPDDAPIDVAGQTE